MWGCVKYGKSRIAPHIYSHLPDSTDRLSPAAKRIGCATARNYCILRNSIWFRQFTRTIPRLVVTTQKISLLFCELRGDWLSALGWLYLCGDRPNAIRISTQMLHWPGDGLKKYRPPNFPPIELLIIFGFRVSRRTVFQFGLVADSHTGRGVVTLKDGMFADSCFNPCRALIFLWFHYRI